MSNGKVLVIIATENREKILTAIMYAKNTAKYGWLEDIRVVFFGPSEKVLAQDREIAERAGELINLTRPVACKYIADADDTSNEIAKLGIDVEYVGELIADLVRQGYVPMVW